MCGSGSANCTQKTLSFNFGNVLQIDLESSRNIQFIKINHNLDTLQNFTIRMGPSKVWSDNTECATLNSDKVQEHECSLVGRFLFVVTQTSNSLASLVLELNSGCKKTDINGVTLEGANHNDMVCNAGYYKHSQFIERCIPCPDHHYKNESGNEFTLCKECPATARSPEASTSFEDCSCDDGNYMKINVCTKCTAATCCMAGEYGTVDETLLTNTCQTCPELSSSTPGARTVEKCRCIAFSNSTFGQACICNPGFSQANYTVCNQCVPGKYKPENGNMPCTNCPQGTYSNDTGAINISSCVYCEDNTYLFTYSIHESNISECRQCPPFSNSIFGQACICNPGSSQANDTVCNQCVPGKYKPENENMPCTNCPQGTYSNDTGAINISVCTPCVALSSSFNGSDAKSSCQCVAGSNGTGQSYCELCRSGTYKNSDKDGSCEICQSGKYSNTSGATSREVCKTCPKYSSSPVASTDFDKCKCQKGFDMEMNICVLITILPDILKNQIYTNISFDLQIAFITINQNVKNTIRKNTADELFIKITRVGLIQVTEKIISNRRLFSSELSSISFIISSPGISEAKSIQKSMTLAKIKSILNGTIDEDIIISEFTISSIITIPPSFEDKSNSINDNIIIYIIYSIGGFFLCLIVIVIFRETDDPEETEWEHTYIYDEE